MIFLKRKILINYLILLILFSCNQMELQVKSIFRGIEIKDDSYQFSDESLFNINSTQYSLRELANYGSDGIIIELVIFKPEGKITYSKDDLMQDKAVLQTLNIPFSQRLYFRNNSIFNQNQVVVEVDVFDSIAVSKGTIKTTFYKLE